MRWDIDKGKELGRYPKPGAGYLSAAAQVGERLLVPNFDGQSVVMWDVTRKKRLWSVEASRDKNYPSLPMTFSADGKLFAVEAPPRVISVYESITGKSVRRLEGDAGKSYYSLRISPDARTVAGSNWDGSLRLWDLESGQERAKITAIQGWITNVFFAPDSKTFATGGGNNAHAVLLWETTTGKSIHPLRGHTSPVWSFAFSPDGRTVATSSWLRGDPVIRLWNPRTGKLLRSLASSERGGVSAVAFSPDGKTLAACSRSGERKVRLWDVGTGRERYALAGHQAGCTCVAFSPDSKRLASGDSYYNCMGQHEGRLCIWDVEGGKMLREIRGTRGAIQRVRFSRDGRHILAAANGVHIYDADSGRLTGPPLQGDRRIWALSLSADGRLLATADERGPARLWELTTGREIALPSPSSIGYDVDLTRDGRTLAVSGSKGGAALFHWPSGQTAGELSGETAMGRPLVFSPDSHLLAMGEDPNSSVLIWDVAGMINRPLPAIARPTEAELRRWWAALGDVDPTAAYKAVWRFVAVPDQTLPFLADTLQPVKAPNPATVARLVEELDSSQFQTREKASRELGRFGEAAASALRNAKRDGISLEKKRRIDNLLARLADPIPSPEQLRALRAMAVLEQIGGPETRKLFTRLAAGAAGARLTHEAKAALERLQRAE